MVLPVPFSQAYWVVPNRLLAGAYPSSTEREALSLLQAGIRHVVSLVGEGEGDSSGSHLVSYMPALQRVATDLGVTVTVARFPIADFGIPSPAGMKAILDSIDGQLALGRPVYVHCRGGIGRTGTVVGCYLAREGIALGHEAVLAIQRLRGDGVESPETEAQRRFVREWRKGA